MKLGKRIGIGVVCVALIALSWILALQSKSDTQKQAELLAQAQTYLRDEVYVRAEPLLEEASGYNGAHTEECETLLKEVYLALLNQQGYTRKYTELLNKQMARKDAPEAVYEEAAEYYIHVGKITEGLNVLKQGIEKLGSERLEELYENNRYVYTLGRNVYDDVTTAMNGAIQVKLNGAWGLAKSDGSLVVPCQYEKVSTYWNGELVVQKDGVISGINASNNRLVLLHADADDFGNYNQNRTSLHMEDGWRLADGELATGRTAFESIGMFSGGYAAASQNGRWGVIDLSGGWYIPAEYDGIVMDELGRCWGQNSIFARNGDEVILLVDGEETEYRYDDARPFGDSGCAAVKRGGKWGFITPTGDELIPFSFDDALSFSQHLAAVEVDGGWGYVSLKGKVVIEPVFLQAKSFYNGSAPIYTVDGWEFISLKEYEAEASL